MATFIDGLPDFRPSPQSETWAYLWIDGKSAGHMFRVCNVDSAEPFSVSVIRLDTESVVEERAVEVSDLGATLAGIAEQLYPNATLFTWLVHSERAA